MAEGGSYHLYCKDHAATEQDRPAIPSWAIFDDQYLENYMLAGTMPGRNNKPKIWTEEGYLRKAGSIEELATLLDIDPATLKATVDRWNGFVDKGVDEDFHRGERVYDDCWATPSMARTSRWAGSTRGHSMPCRSRRATSAPMAAR